MKKLLLTMMCAMMTLVGMAQSKDFEGKLVVTINEVSTDPQDATINFVLNEDMTCNFALNNFCLGSGEGDVMPVGNIKLQNLPLIPVNESTYAFSFEGNILIEEGNMEGVDFWVGPSLEEIPLKLVGTVSMDKMEVSIDINMEKLGQIVQVVFKSDENGSADIDLTNAISFEDDLVVTVNDNSSNPQKAIVYLVPNVDGTYSFVLKNFCLGEGEGDVMPIGNILVPGLVPNITEQGATLAFEGPITIAAGDLEGVDMWMGPMLGEIPLKLSAKSNMTQIYVAIDIVMESLGQTIHVTFGSDYEAGAEADAITGVQQTRSARAFDLQGRPVQRMNHGLYIQNGKKVMK